MASRRLAKLRWFRRAKRIALYYPAGAELDVTALIHNQALRGKQLYLPVVAPGSTARLGFSPWNEKVGSRRNRYGIAEPLHRPAALLRPRQLDLVITPLVGFDADCHRLGAGGGYYDRSFAYRNRSGAWRKPRLVAVAFECQRLERISTQPWDVSLDAVVSERRTYLR